MTDIQTLNELHGEIACYNHGKIADYEILLTKKKEKLMEALKETPSDGHRDIVREYVNFAFEELYNVIHENSVLLTRYFTETKAEAEPNITIKVPVTNNEQVVDIYRHFYYPTFSISDIGENTGFSEIHQTGKYYLNNNIPRTVKAGRYVNKRLTSEALERIQKIDGETIKKWDKEEWNRWIDRSGWLEEWYGIGENNDEIESSGYCSTLIVPVTYMNTEISEESMRVLFPDQSYEDAKRTIWAFVCMDHTKVGYFDPEDIHMAYIIADWLTLYFVSYCLHIENSKTITDIMENGVYSS